jgi:hypothetical protein
LGQGREDAEGCGSNKGAGNPTVLMPVRLQANTLLRCLRRPDPPTYL